MRADHELQRLVDAGKVRMAGISGEQDVIAASYDPDTAPATSVEPDRAKVPSGIHAPKP